MSIWYLKQVKDFIIEFSIIGNFFLEKQFLNLHTRALASFPTGGCVDEDVNNRANDRVTGICFFPSVSFVSTTNDDVNITKVKKT